MTYNKERKPMTIEQQLTRIADSLESLVRVLNTKEPGSFVRVAPEEKQLVLSLVNEPEKSEQPKPKTKSRQKKEEPVINDSATEKKEEKDVLSPEPDTEVLEDFLIDDSTPVEDAAPTVDDVIAVSVQYMKTFEDLADGRAAIKKLMKDEFGRECKPTDLPVEDYGAYINKVNALIDGFVT